MDGADAAVRRIEPGDDAGLREFVDVVNAVTPESPTSIAEIRWSDDLYPGGTRFIGALDGRTVAAASVGRIYMYEATFPRLWIGLHVLPDARRRGLGTALWSACSAVARELGKTGLQTGRLRTPPGRHRVPRAPRVQGHRAREDGPARPAGPRDAGRGAAGRDRPDDPGRATRRSRPGCTRSLSRRMPTSPATTSPSSPAHSTSSPPATCAGTGSRRMPSGRARHGPARSSAGRRLMFVPGSTTSPGTT